MEVLGYLRARGLTLRREDSGVDLKVLVALPEDLLLHAAASPCRCEIPAGSDPHRANHDVGPGDFITITWAEATVMRSGSLCV